MSDLTNLANALIQSPAWTRLDDVLTRIELRLSDSERLIDTASLLSRAAEFRAELVEMAEVAARACHVPVSAVNLVDDKFAVVMACSIDTMDDTYPREQSYCQFVAGTGQSFSVQSAKDHPLARHLHATGAAGAIQAYYGSPIFSPNGYPVGAFCIADIVERRWRNAEVVLVDAYAAQVSALFAETRSS